MQPRRASERDALRTHVIRLVTSELVCPSMRRADRFADGRGQPGGWTPPAASSIACPSSACRSAPVHHTQPPPQLRSQRSGHRQEQRARSAAVADEADDESPPCSPPRPTLARVCSGVMDIPAAADADEQARAPLVGPSVLPAPPPAPGADAEHAAEEAAEPRKLEPNDFTILSLVGQGAFGKVREPGRSVAAHASEKVRRRFFRCRSAFTAVVCSP